MHEGSAAVPQWDVVFSWVKARSDGNPELGGDARQVLRLDDGHVCIANASSNDMMTAAPYTARCAASETQVVRVAPATLMLQLSTTDNGTGTAAQAAAACCKFATADDAAAFQAALKKATSKAGMLANAAGGDNTFDAKTDRASADLYFHYYGMLQHQQNMLQDLNRTGTYYWAIMENRADFEGKLVMDVGAGSGILSSFAAQAGAKKVFAVEASNMASYARQLAAANPSWGGAIEVLHAKVEELELPEKVDVLVSEPMGTLLLNERMLETYIYARDKFLKPGGKMYPRLGRTHVAAFSDAVLYMEMCNKSAFWLNKSFYGVDLTSLHAASQLDYFAQVVVDAFEPSVLMSDAIIRTFDFMTVTEADLHTVTIPLNLRIRQPCMVHGIACWFDVLFDGSSNQRWLSTAPGLPVTHWFQLRCCLPVPLQIMQAGWVVTGEMKLVAHNRQSYDIHLMLTAPPLQPGGQVQRCSIVLDLKEPYYRQLTTWVPQVPLQQPQQPMQQTTDYMQH